MIEFWLGTHMTGWLETTDVPLFVSRRRLLNRDTGRLRARLPRAATSWALDSGGFTELEKFGGWSIDHVEYAREVARIQDEVGNLAWAAPQDWMCEPHMLASTGRDVAEHQRLTVENFLRIRDQRPDLPIIPVLQGWQRDDYLACADLYDRAGVDLAAEALVGVGSVCRRQNTAEAEGIFLALRALGLRLHGFGVKVDGFDAYADLLDSADSMAWSYRARMARRDGAVCPRGKTSCSNCLHFALDWRAETVLPRLGTPPRPRQQPLWKDDPCPVA